MKEQRETSSRLFLLIVIALIVTLIQITGVHATLSFSNYADFKLTPEISKYGSIDVYIGNWIFPDEKIATYSLIDNTDQCLINCEWKIKAILLKEGTLFDNLKFLNGEVKSSTITILNGENYEVDVNDYKQVCKEVISEKNGTISQDCHNEIIGTHKETKYRDLDYKGQTLPAGTYDVIGYAEKNPRAWVDWVINKEDVDLTQWAWWNSSWTKKKQINITQATTAMSGYQADINITWITGMSDDFGDLRFLNGSETGELNYTFLSVVNDASAYVRIRVDNLLNGTTPIYMYYGNALASSGDTGRISTDDYWEDFSAGTFNGWTTVSASSPIWVNNSILNITGADQVNVYKNMTAKMNANVDYKKVSWSMTITAGGYLDYSPIANGTRGITDTYAYTDDFGTNLASGNKLKNYGNVIFAGTPTNTGWNDVSLSRAKDGSVYNVTFILNNTILYSTKTETAVTSFDFMNIYAHVSSSTYDNFSVIKYLPTSPTFLFGGEEVPATFKLNISTTLISPINNTNYSAIYPLIFSANATALNGNITNMSLYIDGVQANTTLGLTGSFNSSSWTISKADGTYIWNVLSCGINSTDSLCAWDGTNRTFNVHTAPPSISIIQPNSTYIVYSPNQNISLNYTIIDAYLDSCWYNSSFNATRISLNCAFNSSITYPATNPSSLTIYVYANDTFGNVNYSNVTITKDTNPPFVSISYPNKIIISASNISLNFSATDGSIGTCWYNYNGINKTISCSVNNSFIYANGINNITLYANDSFGNVNSTISSNWIYLNSESHNSEALTSSLQTFTFNISSNTYPSLPYIIYNGTSHLGTITTSGNNYIISTSFNVPYVTSTTNETFYLSIVDILGDSFNSSVYNQTLTFLQVDNCSTYSGLLFNFTQKDEDTEITLDGATQNSSISLSINLYDASSNNLIGFYNNTYSKNSNPQICFNNTIANNSVYVKGLVEYQASSYVHKFYYLQNYNITSSIFNVNLYDLLTTRSQEFLVTYKDANFLLAPNVLVYVTRDYISQNQFKTIEVAKTDNNGNALIHLVLGNVNYNLIFIDSNNNILSILDNYVPFCEDIVTGNCRINTNAFSSTADLIDYSQIGGITYNQVFNKTSRTIQTDFISVSGATTINQTIIKYDRFGNNTICSSKLTSPSGSITCNIPITYGNVDLLTSVYSDGELVSQSVYSISQSPTQIYGLEGIIFAVIIILTLVMISITSLAGIVIMAIFSVILCGLLGFLVVGSTFGFGAGIITGLILAGAILVWQISKGGEAK